MIGTLTLGSTSALLAQDGAAVTGLLPAPQSTGCLEDATGFLRARLNGSVQAEITWQGDALECSGGHRPDDDGLRLRFSHPDPQEGTLVIVFGVAGKPAAHARDLPVNLTVIREGRGEFYSTQGDGKCMLDELHLTPLEGQAMRAQARGFCTQPARAVRGDGAVLMSRFDFIGRLDLDTEDTAQPIPAGEPIVSRPIPTTPTAVMNQDGARPTRPENP